MMATAPAVETPRYRRWAKRGQRHSSTGGWINIALTGFRLFYKRPSTQRIVWLSSGFVLGSCIVFYLLSLLETLAGTQQAEGIIEFLHGVLGVNLSGASQLGEFRPVLWRTVYLFTFKAELFVVLIVVAQVGGRLIARDLKARALPIYFARPITPLTYLLGKWMVAAMFIGLVTLVPNLISLVVGTLL
ncbi:MAG: hypothetical protein GY778_13980, partial [bacterium]|nr:hypothetical protein [bacterium]